MLNVRVLRALKALSEPPVVPHADLSNQRADILRPADRSESALHRSYVLDALLLTTGTLPAHVMERHPQAIRQRAVDDTADHRALPGDRRRLEGGSLGRRVDRDRDNRVLPIRAGRRTPARESGGGSDDYSFLSSTGSANPSSFNLGSCVFASPTTSQIIWSGLYIFLSQRLYLLDRHVPDDLLAVFDVVGFQPYLLMLFSISSLAPAVSNARAWLLIRKLFVVSRSCSVKVLP